MNVKQLGRKGENMEEEFLVRKAIKGDVDAFEKLIEKYKDRLYREAFLRCKNEEDTKEIIQEAVYKAFKGIGKLREPQYFKTWISRIVINVANDFLNEKGMVDLQHEVENFKKEIKVEDSIAVKIDLYNAIDELEDKYKDAIILRYIEDLKIEEIAKTLNRPINTIKTHIRKGIDDMKKLLKEGYINE